MKTKRFVSTLLALLLVCSLPVSAFAMDDNPVGGQVSVPTGETMGTNNGTVTKNSGTVTTNNNLIFVNNFGAVVGTNNEGAEVTSNEGTVTTNNGTVASNHRTVTTNNGTVSSNNKTVTANNGTVTSNNSSGTVNTNSSTGTVITNDGTVTTNSGTVTGNNKTVTTNNGTVETNNNYVEHNSGTVETNNGTVNSNHDTVETNNGTVGYNDTTGTVNTNNGTVEENGGTVETNNTTGTVSNISGTVTTNYGTVNKLEWVNGIGFVPISTRYGVLVDNDGTKTLEEYCEPNKVLDFSQLTKEGYVYAGYTQEYQLLDGVLTKQALTVNDTSYTVTCPNVLTLIWQAIASPVTDDGTGSFGPGSVISINGHKFLLVAVVEDVYCLASVDSFEDEALSDLPALLASLLTEEQLSRVTGEPELLDEALTARFFAGQGSHIVFPCDSSLIFF